MGGASGLNILQQKSWHVLRRHNIERVRKDQREEKERQQKEDDRKDLAEFESKLDHLRSKASKDSTAVATTSSNEPLNLFKVTDLKDLKNVDKAIEDQQDEDKRLRKEGFLTYLGETVIENDSPWYATQVDTKKLKDEEKFAKDEIRKTNEDPLAKFAKEMKWAAPKKEDNIIPLRQPEHLLRIDFEEEARQKLSFSPPRSKKSKKENKERRIKKEKKRKRKRSYSRSRSPSRSTRVKREKSTSPEFISESRPRKKKSKRERSYSRSTSRSKRNRDVKRERSSSPDYISESRSKKKKSKRSRRSPETAKSSSAASSSSAALIAMLKAKANKRIEREQAKTQELFDKINGVVKTQPEEPEEEVDERKRGYNSCFNPKFQATKERRRNSEY